MSEETSGEKSFAPTDKRKTDAAKKGDVLRSKELGTAIAIIAGCGWLMAAGPWLFSTLEGAARDGFTFERSSLENFSPGSILLPLLLSILPPVLFLGASVMVATIISQLLIGDGRFMMGNLTPKPSRINPMSGLKRMFGMQGLIELGKSVLKIALLGSLAYWWGASHIAEFFGLGRADLRSQLSAAWDAATTLLMILSFGLAIIAMIDWPIQFIRRMSRLKMTFQEMRDEQKQTEGSPEKRGAQRQRQREIARGGAARAMENAQFLLTNPSHFAVALTYDPALASAPIVLAKGRDEKALAMRELAAERGLPVLEYPLLARSVYFTTRENQMIREELYVAIASLMAFVFSLKRGEHPPRPHVDVPLALRFDTTGKPSGKTAR